MLTKDAAKHEVRTALEMALEHLDNEDVFMTVWAVHMAGEALRNDEVLAAFGKKLVWEGHTQRMVDRDKED